MNRPISGTELMRFCHDIVIRDYNDLYPTMNLRSFFGPNNAIALLYRPNGKTNVGHWIFMQKLNETTVEFFDPYGFLLDSSEMGISIPLLSIILRKGGIKTLIMNDEPIQSRNPKIQTCGRHVALRCMLRYIPLDNYVKFLRKAKVSPDESVTYFTRNL